MNIYKQPWKLIQNRVRGQGGREIDKLRGISPPTDDDHGSEAWIGSVTRAHNATDENPVGCSEVVLPDGRRMYLYEAIQLDPEAILGKKHFNLHGTGLGMLVKYLDAKSQYGLQSHPTREWAKKMWNSDFGKEESWYVIGTRDDSSEPAYVLLGFKENVSRADMEKHFYDYDLSALEKLCHKIPVQIGDTFFVGGGVPHALGEGCFVIELQEPSDITVAPVPYGRMPGANELSESEYNERMLGTFLYDGCDYEENLKRNRIPVKMIRDGDWGSEYYIIGPDQTSFFSFTRADVDGTQNIRDTGFPQVAIVLEGEGEILYEGGALRVKRGDELFLPYQIPKAAMSGKMSIVFCHPEGAQ